MVSGILGRRVFPYVLGTSISLLSSTVQAQERDPAAAQALFDQARELSRQGKFAEACPKLQESNRLDPGIGTQFHLADCYEQSGRIASAWAQFLDVASQARASSQLDREKAATNRAQKLEPRLPRLLVNVPEGSKTPGLEIRRNGMLVGSAQWGVPLPVDPGEVELTASAPGKQTLRQTLRVEEGKTASYNLPVLAQGDPAAAPPDAGAPAPPPAAAPAPLAPTPVAPPDAPAAKSGGNAPLILTLAGVGVVGIGVGTVFALTAKTKYNESKAECDPEDLNSCSPTGVTLRNDARGKGDIASVGFIVGGVALAGAGIVWLASGSSSEKKSAATAHVRATPAIGPNLAALFVQGRF